MRPPSLHTLTALYKMVEMHEGMQSCCKHQQCCAHIKRGRMRVRVLHVSRIRSEMQHRDRYRDKREARLHFKSSMECAKGGNPAAGDCLFTCCHQIWEQTHNTGFSPTETHPHTNKHSFILAPLTHKKKHHSRWKSCPIICLLKRSVDNHLSEEKLCRCADVDENKGHSPHTISHNSRWIQKWDLQLH